MFLVKSESGQYGTAALVRLREDRDVHCLVASSHLFPSIDQLSTTSIFMPRAENEEHLLRERVQKAWIDKRRDLVFVELTSAGLWWSIAGGVKAHTLASHVIKGSTVTNVRRQGPDGPEERNQVNVKSVQQHTLQLNKAIDDGILLDSDNLFLGCVVAKNKVSYFLADSTDNAHTRTSICAR